MQEKNYCVIGWRLSKRQKEELHKRGLFTYANRSWDTGYGCTLEHRVIVNHEGDVVTNFPALDEDDREDYKNDFYQFMDEVGAESSEEFYNSIKDVLNDDFLK